jgi:hypothetical protein
MDQLIPTTINNKHYSYFSSMLFYIVSIKAKENSYSYYYYYHVRACVKFKNRRHTYAACIFCSILEIVMTSPCTIRDNFERGSRPPLQEPITLAVLESWSDKNLLHASSSRKFSRKIMFLTDTLVKYVLLKR